MENRYEPDTLFDLDLGPWAYDAKTNIWVHADGRLAAVGWLSKNRWNPPKWKRMSPHSTGYVCCGGAFVHQIVARAWLTKPTPTSIVNHKDGDKHNNHPSNLEWVNHSENLSHAYAIGLRSMRRTPELEQAVREALQTGKRFWGRGDIAKKFNVNVNVVKSIVTEIQNETTK
jgi:hypothetical protein